MVAPPLLLPALSLLNLTEEEGEEEEELQEGEREGRREGGREGGGLD